jgi:iron complex outermembrane receptor protein
VTELDNLTIKPRVYWRWNRDKYLFVRDNPDIYQNLHFTNTISAEVNSSYRSNLGTTGIGIEYRKEMIKGDWIRGGAETKSNLDGFGRDNFGMFFDHRFKIGNRLDITPGIYVNWYSDFGWNAFPGVDAGYNISRNLRIYGNFGKSYRIPTFYDQYYGSPAEEGNPDLKPEEALSYELGLRYLTRGVALEANYFVRDASQLIDWIYDPVDSIWRSDNFQNVRAAGLELSASIDFTDLVDANFPISNINVSYNYIDQNLRQVENLQSRYVLEHIRHQAIFGIEHKIIGKLKNTFTARYIDRFGQEPYLLFDDRLYYEPNDLWNVFVEATNLTDQQYTEVMTPMPGRWIRVGLNLQIGL